MYVYPAGIISDEGDSGTVLTRDSRFDRIHRSIFRILRDSGRSRGNGDRFVQQTRMIGGAMGTSAPAACVVVMAMAACSAGLRGASPADPVRLSV